MENATDFDYLLFLSLEKIEPLSYFDVNRIHKLKDKLTPQVGKLMTTVIEKLKAIGKQQVSPSDFICNANLMLLEMASQPKCPLAQFEKMVNELKQYNYVVQY